MVTLQAGIFAMTPPVAASPPTPADLPPAGDARRWQALQRLRRQVPLDPLPWITAIETGLLPLEADLIAVLAPHLDGPLACRLLDSWMAQANADAAIPSLIGACRDQAWAARLRQLLDQVPPAQPLATVARDLQPSLAAAALDLLARLPGARADLLRLAGESLDPSLELRLQRRLAALPAAPLLLLVHGRSGGRLPAELRALAVDLEQRRGAPVQLLALTDPQPPLLPPAAPLAPPATLVPLLLLPGSHARLDLPAITAALRRQGPLRRLPFLGSWPLWQRALAEELADLTAATASAEAPLLLHHPLQGALAERFLALLARRCGALCRPAGFDGSATLLWPSGGGSGTDPAVLPLALAANRLTDALRSLAPHADARPLLERPRLRRTLLEALAALP